MDDETQSPWEQRANRGSARGAEDVLGSARAIADRPPPHRSGLIGVGAIALALATLAGAITLTRGDADDPVAAPVSTTTTAEPAPVIAQSDASLVLFDSASVLDALKEEALARVGPYGLPGSERYGYGWFGVEDQGAFARRDFSEQSGGLAPDTPSVSGTNNQEAGVDEPDLVETDGRRLYDVHGGTLHVVDVATARVVATLPLGLVNVDGAVLVDDVLVVFANEPLSDYGSEAKVTLVDVSGTPTAGERLRIDGTIVDARVSDGRVHLVTVRFPSLRFTYPSWEGDGTGAAATEEAATEANEERIRGSVLTDWLPGMTVASPDGTDITFHDQLTDCDQIRRPKTFAGFDQTSLVTLDLADLSASESTSVQASSLLVYGSADSVYTATTSVDDLEPGRANDLAVAVAPHTDIHRFSLEGTPTYVGSGRVDGYVADQFGLSEDQGHLRVASSSYEGSTRSLVTVLRVDPGELTKTGVLDGLGVDEEIQGVRFVGDRGYVVTFRQTDPLHIIDLHDPTAPRLAGVLQVPGYSAYLHPVADGRLLGVGRDGTDTGQLTGGAVSLFDVSAPDAPTRLDLEDLGPTAGALAETDSHAFTWWPETQTAYLPIGVVGVGGRVVALHVDGDALTKVGEVAPAGAGAPASAEFDRVVVVGDRLLSVSPTGVQVSNRATLAPIAWVPFG